MLKGPSFARWLYPPGEPRGYGDSDLLVSPSDRGRADSVLAGLGFARRYDVGGLPDWWTDHADEWWRVADAVWVDLHHTIGGLGVRAEAAWDVLSDRTEPLEVGGEQVHVLDEPARALHLALHAAHHGQGWGKVHEDLRRALAVVSVDTWREACALAAALDAVDPFGVGLRLVPEGVALADRLQLPANRSVEVALRAGAPPPLALAFEEVARAAGLRKVVFLARKLVPPPGFMRHWYPRAQHSRLSLAFAYLYRPYWIATRALPAWRAWRRERRRVRAGGG